jgi:hypothetical protein
MVVPKSYGFKTKPKRKFSFICMQQRLTNALLTTSDQNYFSLLLIKVTCYLHNNNEGYIIFIYNCISKHLDRKVCLLRNYR